MCRKVPWLSETNSSLVAAVRNKREAMRISSENLTLPCIVGPLA